MSTAEQNLQSINIFQMGDSLVAPNQNFDLAIARLSEGIVGVRVLDLSAGGAVDFVATADHIRGAIVVLNGATAARNIVVLTLPFKRLFINPSAFAIVVKCAATAGVSVSASSSIELWCDGATVKAVEVRAVGNVDDGVTDGQIGFWNEATGKYEPADARLLPAGGAAGQVPVLDADGVTVIWVDKPVDGTDGEDGEGGVGSSNVDDGTANGQVPKWNTATGKYEPGTDNVSSGGGGGSTLLPLDIVPGSAWDDDWSAGVIDAKWTQISSTAPTDTTIENGILIFKPTGAGNAPTGNYGAYGLRQNAPTGDFKVRAKVARTALGYNNVGIFVASTSNTRAHTLGIHGSLADSVEFISTDAYQEAAPWGEHNGVYNTLTLRCATWVWLEIEWNSATATLKFKASNNGYIWQDFFSVAGQIQPNRIGLQIYRADITFGVHALCERFSVIEL